ncbi:MAG TPA: type IV pilus secretin PilQ [Terriglobales bacterium]|nr:type IV pilus secretin PilQ [Terriglobales bacterium]
MRKQVLGLIIPLLALALVATAADVTVKAASSLEGLQLSNGRDGLRVEFKAKGPLAPKVTTLDSPARIVIDLPNTVMATSQSSIPVGQDGVKGIRIGMDAQRNTRVVLDVTGNLEHQFTAADGRYVLTVAAPTKVAKAVEKTATPKIINVAQQSVAPKAETPAPKLELASATVPQTLISTSAPASAPADKPADFAVVEPKYTTKPAEPAVKAEEAASRFSDKTAAELVATTSNAAMQDAEKVTPAVNLAAEQKAQLSQKPAANGAKYTGEPISVNLKDVDLKDFFRLIHEISGLNVVLDPQVHGTLTIVLDDVPWDQALDIVLKNNDLSRQLDGNVLRIATIDTLKHEAESRRAQIDAEALAVDKVTITRFLSYAHSKDVLPTIRKFLSQRGDVVADERTNALIVSDIPAVLPGIDRIIQQMDRKTQEVEIEARVVSATRSFARDIGTQLGFGWGNGTTQVGGVPGNAGAGASPYSGTSPNPLYPMFATGSSNIPLFSNLGAPGPTSALGFSTGSNNFRLDFALTMAESRGLLKVLSRPRVVTQNNIQAIVKQGVRVPVVTTGQLGGPPTTTYVDAFLRLTVTPQITSEGTIFLNVDVENTLPDFGHEDQFGNPTLITQQATTQVLVTDGGTVVIGGVIQTNNSLSILSVPVLGDIPYLGNLFKRRSVSTSTQELIFFITPRIVQT